MKLHGVDNMLGHQLAVHEMAGLLGVAVPQVSLIPLQHPVLALEAPQARLFGVYIRVLGSSWLSGSMNPCGSVSSLCIINSSVSVVQPAQTWGNTHLWSSSGLAFMGIVYTESLRPGAGVTLRGLRC